LAIFALEPGVGSTARSGMGKHFLRRATLKILLLSRAACSYYIYYIN